MNVATPKSSNNDLDVAGTLTLGDMVRFTYYHFVSRAWPLALFFLAMFVVSLFGIVTILIGGDPERIKNPGFFWFIAAAWIGLLAFSPYWSAKRLLKKQPYFKQPMRYLFTEDRIRVDGEGFAGELTWPLVHVIRETKTSFLIYHSAQIAWLLPKRFFANAYDINLWREFVIKHLPKSKQYSKPGPIAKWF